MDPATQPEDLARRVIAQAARVRDVEPALVDLARRDGACFCAYVLRDEESGARITVADHQRQWHKLLDQHKRVLVWSSIESGKSNQVSIGRVLFELGCNPNLRVLIVSATDHQATNISRAIRRYIEQSAELRRVFPHLVPGDEWTDSSFSVRRPTLAKDPSVRAVGVQSTTVLGARVDLLILDDVLNLANTMTSHQRAALLRWVQSNALGRLTARARVWVVGTAFHKEDLLHHLAAQPGYKALRFPVVVRDPVTGLLRSQWEARWPMERVEAKRLELGPLEFARQLMCEARDDDQARFRREWIDRAKAAGDGKRMAYQLQHVPSGYRTITGVDLAVQQHSAADLTAFVTIIVHPAGTREVLCVESGRWTGPEIIDRLRETTRRYGSTLVVENNAAQDFIRQFAHAAGIPTVPFTTGRNKAHPELGVEGIAVELARGDWVIPSVEGRGEAEVEALCGEMLWYDPREHTGDRLMAMWFAREGVRLTTPKPQAEAEVGSLRLLTR